MPAMEKPRCCTVEEEEEIYLFSVRNKCQAVFLSFINIDKNYIRAITTLRSIDYTSVVYYSSKIRFNIFASLIKEIVY